MTAASSRAGSATASGRWRASGTHGDHNTGGGGGGSGAQGLSGGNGGSGVVIISFLNGSLTASITGATNTKVVGASETVCTFNESGDITFGIFSPFPTHFQ